MKYKLNIDNIACIKRKKIYFENKNTFYRKVKC